MKISKYIDRLANRIAEFIFQRAGRTPVYKLKFAIKDLLYYLLFYIPIIISGIFTGRLLESLITPLVFSAIRRYSGGFHLSSATGCAAMSAAMVIIAIYMPGQYWYNGLVYTALSALAMAVFAPANVRVPQSQQLPFKWVSMGLVASNFFIQSHLLAMIFLLQSLTILPYDYLRRR
jgi:accessory gene regulator B